MGKKKLPDLIDALTKGFSNVICFSVIIMTLLVSAEVISRYVFNRPTYWIWPVNKQLFGIFVLFSGAYTMLKQSHIRIEMIYERLSGKLKLLARLLYFFSFIIFMGVLIWQGTLFGWDSFVMGERAVGQFRIPVYPLKLLIPVGAFFLLLQGLVVIIREED